MHADDRQQALSWLETALELHYGGASSGDVTLEECLWMVLGYLEPSRSRLFAKLQERSAWDEVQRAIDRARGVSC